MLGAVLQCMTPSDCPVVHPCPGPPRAFINAVRAFGGLLSRLVTLGQVRLWMVANNHRSVIAAFSANSLMSRTHVLSQAYRCCGRLTLPHGLCRLPDVCTCKHKRSTGGGPVSYVQLSEGGCQVVNPLGLWSRFSGVVKVQFVHGN